MATKHKRKLKLNGPKPKKLGRPKHLKGALSNGFKLSETERIMLRAYFIRRKKHPGCPSGYTLADAGRELLRLGFKNA